jgi:hypothetical protein
MGEQGEPGDGDKQDSDQQRPRPSLAGRVLGFVGLLVAAILLRGRTTDAADEHEHATA